MSAPIRRAVGRFLRPLAQEMRTTITVVEANAAISARVDALGEQIYGKPYRHDEVNDAGRNVAAAVDLGEQDRGLADGSDFVSQRHVGSVLGCDEHPNGTHAPCTACAAARKTKRVAA